MLIRRCAILALTLALAGIFLGQSIAARDRAPADNLVAHQLRALEKHGGM